MFTEVQAQQLNVDFKFLNARRSIEGQTTADPKDFRVIAVRAAQYGALEPGSVSAWVRAMVELDREGVIRLRTPAPLPIEVPRDFGVRVASMSASEVRRAYQRDPEFRKLFDALSLEEVKNDGSVQLHAEGPAADINPYGNFSARDWKSTPAQTLARMMNTSAFRERVEHIIAHGDQNGERI